MEKCNASVHAAWLDGLDPSRPDVLSVLKFAIKYTSDSSSDTPSRSAMRQCVYNMCQEFIGQWFDQWVVNVYAVEAQINELPRMRCARNRQINPGGHSIGLQACCGRVGAGVDGKMLVWRACVCGCVCVCVCVPVPASTTRVPFRCCMGNIADFKEKCSADAFSSDHGTQRLDACQQTERVERKSVGTVRA